MDLIIDPHSTAQLLSKTFSDSFTIDNYHCRQVPKLVLDNTGISSTVSTPGLLRKSINHLRAKSKGCRDRIPHSSLQSVHFMLVMSYVFQSSFSAGFMPPVWSQAHIIPIIKVTLPTLWITGLLLLHAPCVNSRNLLSKTNYFQANTYTVGTSTFLYSSLPVYYKAYMTGQSNFTNLTHSTSFTLIFAARLIVLC